MLPEASERKWKSLLPRVAEVKGESSVAFGLPVPELSV